jgi:hypothetical protein
MILSVIILSVIVKQQQAPSYVFPTEVPAFRCCLPGMLVCLGELSSIPASSRPTSRRRCKVFAEGLDSQ